MQVETAHSASDCSRTDGTAERLGRVPAPAPHRGGALIDRMLVRSKDHAGTSSLN